MKSFDSNTAELFRIKAMRAAESLKLPLFLFADPPPANSEMSRATASGSETACAHDVWERSDVMRWRKAERLRLIDERLKITAVERERRAAQIAVFLDRVMGDISGRTISLYWPLRGEPDLRSWMHTIWSRGGICGLPVVVARNTPLIFRLWTPRAAMELGFWNIPVPVDRTEVTPDVVLAPVVGFDSACYRLGYGGGYFDRTLQTLSHNPIVLGVGYSQAAISTIHPQPHDIPMDRIITEGGISC